MVATNPNLILSSHALWYAAAQVPWEDIQNEWHHSTPTHCPTLLQQINVNLALQTMEALYFIRIMCSEKQTTPKICQVIYSLSIVLSTFVTVN